MSDFKADLLVVTVNKNETTAFIELSEQATGKAHQSIKVKNSFYNLIGNVNGTVVYHVISEMGSGTPGGMQQTVSKAIADLSPGSIISLGVAFGIDSKKQKIGDVLVSKQLSNYDLQKVGKNSRVFRGDKVTASTKLLSFFRNAEISWKDKVETGLILSGEKLIDDLTFRQELKSQEPEAIGGEMEGNGLYVAARESNVDWIIIKAICDWADGDKSKNKNQRQVKASKNAAAFLLHALSKSNLAVHTGIIIPVSPPVRNDIREEIPWQHLNGAQKLTELRKQLYKVCRKLPGMQSVRHQSTFSELIREMKRLGHLTEKDLGILKECVRVCNDANRGEQIPQPSVDWTVKSGEDLLEKLVHLSRSPNLYNSH